MTCVAVIARQDVLQLCCRRLVAGLRPGSRLLSDNRVSPSRGLSGKQSKAVRV